ncbi:hypothetical protein, partial [Massilia sp. UYP11]|uniref:hypothetical protein n=1 Tax=Massilia sp. UYP11 TaxID=1756385 RepID=UPI003D261742
IFLHDCELELLIVLGHEKPPKVVSNFWGSVHCGALSFVPVDGNCAMELFRLPHLRIRKTGLSPRPYIFFLRALAR